MKRITIVILSVIGLLACLTMQSRNACADGDNPWYPGCKTDGDHQGQLLGGCWGGGKWCAGPAAALPVVALNLKTGKWSGGADAISLGPCYGVMRNKGTWYALGIDACLSISLAQDAPNRVMPSLMLHLTDWGYLGIGTVGKEGSNGLYWQGVLLVGARVGL